MVVLGAAAMAVGLIMMLVGTFLAWRAEIARLRSAGALRSGPEAFVSKLTELLQALSAHPVGIRLVALGIVVFFLGGVVSSVSALTA
jgi:hypothetical protein